MDSLTPYELKTIYKTVCRAKQSLEDKPKTLKDFFASNPRLIITPSNQCNKYCSHCVADSLPNGEVMPYDKFTNINPEFFQIFPVADFGRRGNPLTYSSQGVDLKDILGHLNNSGINKFTLALAIQNNEIPVIKRLEDFVEKEDIRIETMVTYHHYFNNLDTSKLAKDFNATLKNYSRFSKKIIISLLGDVYPQKTQTKAEEVNQTFQNDKKIIFKDFNVIQTEPEGNYSLEHKDKKIELFVPKIDTRVYPLGRFKQYLSQKGILEDYEKKFNESLTDYVCPDLIKWPGIIIEPNGDLNFCASFEAMNCNQVIISNIFDKSFSQVQTELKEFYEKEINWFIDNLQDITTGKVSTCKIKNNCYSNKNS